MKSIYLLLTKSDTYVSKTIGLATSDKYTHISISFEESLQPMYSFARKYKRTPLPAGIRNEALYTGFYEKCNHIPCALYELKVDNETYEKAKSHVDEMMENADYYKYNLLGLILCRMNIAYDRKSHYFCSEFVSEVLEKSNALELPKHPSLMRPADYTKMKELNCLFDGKLHELKSSIQSNYQYC